LSNEGADFYGLLPVLLNIDISIIMHFPIVALCGERLRLDTFAAADISDAYIGWLNDPEVVRFSNQRFRQHDAKSCLSYLESFCNTENLLVAIRTMHDGRMIGTMTAYLAPQHGTADMGLLIGERGLWGQGFGLEAWNLLMNHLLHGCGLRKVTGGTLRCNVGMVQIMERSGMQLEAVRSRQELVNGEPQDVLYFAKFHDD